MKYYSEMHEIGHEGHTFQTDSFNPIPQLSHHIQKYFALRKEDQLSNSSYWYMLPDNNVHLIFYLFNHKDKIVPDWRVIGPRSKHKIIDRTDRKFTFCCTFKPGGFRNYSNVPISELVDRSSPAGAILRQYSYHLFEKLTQLALVEDIKGFISTFEAFLLTFPGKSLFRPDTIFDNIALCSSTTEMARALGYSERHLRNLTKEHIGHSPKLMLQIQRLTKTLHRSVEDDDWTQIAYSSGYYDQSHMISDFQKFIGSSPTRLFS